MTAWYNSGVTFAQQAQPLTPLIVKVVEQPAKEISVADILLGSIGITGLFLLGAALLGVAMGCGFILLRRWRDAHDDGATPAENPFHLTVPPE